MSNYWIVQWGGCLGRTAYPLFIYINKEKASVRLASTNILNRWRGACDG